MVDVEEGELVEQDLETALGQNIGGNRRAENQDSCYWCSCNEEQESCNNSCRRRNKKKNRRKEGNSGDKRTEIKSPSNCLDKAERLLAEAASYGSQLVVFPEAFVGGYPRGSNFGATIGNRTAKGKEEFRKYHSAAINVPGPEVDRLAAMAGKYKVHLVMGVIERDGYTLYCTVLFFDSQGLFLGKHRKLMPTALERIIWGFGDGSTVPVFETAVGKIGAAICWENRMPLLRTAMYAKGIEIYCAPTADARDVWQASVTHIALEGGCFVLSANQFCRRKDYPPPPDYVFQDTEEDLTPDSVICAGGSVIISPSGAVLAGPNYEGEALISADLDLGEIARAKFDFDVVGHYSRSEFFNLTVVDRPTCPVTFTSTPGSIKCSEK